MKKKHKDFIEENLRYLIITVDILNKGLQINEWDKYQTAGIGAYLADVYKGYENILKALLEDKGIKIAKGEQWHKYLLETAKSEKLVPDEMSTTLREMLGFRHLQIHGYSHILKEKELRDSALEAIKSHPIFEKHIKEILETRNS